MFNNFPKACHKIRNSLYGFKASSPIGSGQTNISTGTAFMIAPGILLTTAHSVHFRNDRTQPRHVNFRAIRAPDVGQQMERCVFIAEDAQRDIALVRIENPRSLTLVKFHPKRLPIGTPCGSLGYPLSSINPRTGSFSLIERFQGANIAGYNNFDISGRQLFSYETDALMYSGSSGCPGFLINGRVYAMHNASIIDPATTQTAGNNQSTGNRVAISLWVPAQDIIVFARNNEIDF